MNSIAEIVAFMQERGMSLRHLGSGEYGLSKSDALVLLEKLCNSGVAPLGIELWRKDGESYWLEAAQGWYTSKIDVDRCCAAAKAYLAGPAVTNADLVTVQFSGNPATADD